MLPDFIRDMSSDFAAKSLKSLLLWRPLKSPHTAIHCTLSVSGTWSQRFSQKKPPHGEVELYQDSSGRVWGTAVSHRSRKKVWRDRFYDLEDGRLEPQGLLTFRYRDRKTGLLVGYAMLRLDPKNGELSGNLNYWDEELRRIKPFPIIYQRVEPRPVRA